MDRDMDMDKGVEATHLEQKGGAADSAEYSSQDGTLEMDGVNEKAVIRKT